MDNKAEEKEVNQIALPQPGQMAKFTGGLDLGTLDKMLVFAEYVAKSPFCPKAMQKPGDIVVCLQSGAEIGLPPMMSLQSIAVINGRPGIFGDAALALVRASGLLESFKEELIGEPGTDARGYRVTLKRVGMDEATEEYTVADAKMAKLWQKKGHNGQDTPWITNPKRMLKFRCRGFALRDNFGDVLKGLKTIEELNDYPEETAKAEAGSLVNSVSEPKEEPKNVTPDPKKEKVASDDTKKELKSIILEKLRQICPQNGITPHQVEAWCKAKGRNIDLFTDEGWSKVKNSWDSVVESIKNEGK